MILVHKIKGEVFFLNVEMLGPAFNMQKQLQISYLQTDFLNVNTDRPNIEALAQPSISLLNNNNYLAIKWVCLIFRYEVFYI